MRLEGFLSINCVRILSSTRILNWIAILGIMGGENSLAQPDSPREKEATPPLVIKPKDDSDSTPLNISDLKSGEDSLRSSINLETEKGTDKILSQTETPEVQETREALENPEILKITPISTGQVVDISVSEEKEQEKETEILGDFSFPEESTPKEDLEGEKGTNTLDSESVILLDNESEKALDPDPKETNNDHSEPTKPTETTEPTEPTEPLNLNDTPTEVVKTSETVKTNTSRATSLVTASTAASTAKTPTDDEIKEALKDKYKEIADSIQNEINTIKSSGRSVSPKEREEFQKRFENEKELAKEEFLKKREDKPETDQNNELSVESELSSLENLDNF
jgi:hypothetical protein